MQLTKFFAPVDKFTLAPIGDIQFGAVGCDEGKLKRHVNYGVKHDWWFLGMGDYLDTDSPSQRPIRRSLRDQGPEHKEAMKAADALVDGPLHKSAGRWIGMVHGDHTREVGQGKLVDQYIAEELSAPYLGSASIIEVTIGDCPRPLRVFATHGRGASVSPTGKTLHLQRLLSAFDADIYLMGHSHSKYGVAVDRLCSVEVDGKLTLRHETKILGITGSWLNGYQQDSTNADGWLEGSYVEKAAMAPLPTGGIVITVKPKKDKGFWRMDMFVSA